MTAGPTITHPRPMRLPRWGMWLLLLLLMAAPAQAATQTIDSALSVLGSDGRFPAGSAGQPVSLPDDWATHRPDVRGPVWYRASFRVETTAEPLLALYIERICTNLAVLLNGHMIYNGGRLSPPLTYQCNHPQLITLPAALLQPGENLLDIQVIGQPLAEVGSRHRAGHLSRIEIGPHDGLAERHALLTAIKVNLPQAVGATLLLMGLFMFVMGFTQRRDSHLAYFGALCVGWAIVDARLWLRHLPVSSPVAEFLLAAMLPFLTLAAVQFLLRYARRRLRLADVALPLQCAVMPLTLVLAGPGRLYPALMSWELLCAAQVAAAGIWYLKLNAQRRTLSFWLMAALLAAVLLVGLIEFAAQISGTGTQLAQFAQLLPPVLLVVMGLRLVQQHGRALVEAEAGKAQLEQRVREATSEIESNFRQLAELRVEQVTERERKRIAADLHDDLGAKLLTIVHTSESERISTLAREALEEMRLSVRGLTGKPVQLADALGDWRVEVVQRLSQAGIECEWSAPEGEELPQRLSARAYVQTTRILREATSNIIKHSAASRCMVTCTVADGDFLLLIQDNGNGIAADVELRLDRGHGLASMKARAKQLQGQCLVESGPGYGTVIRLTLPMDRATQAR